MDEGVAGQMSARGPLLPPCPVMIRKMRHIDMDAFYTSVEKEGSATIVR